MYIQGILLGVTYSFKNLYFNFESSGLIQVKMLLFILGLLRDLNTVPFF